MDFILPIVPCSEEEASVLLSTVCDKPLVLHLADRVASVDSARLLVYTTDVGIRDFFESRNVAVRHDPDHGGSPFPSHPEAMKRALEYFLKDGTLSPDTPVVVADCRNPFIARETLESCHSLLSGHASTGYASFESVRDHPLQMFNIHRVAGIGMHVFSESRTHAPAVFRRFGIAGDCLVSAPFTFDWREMDVWDEKPGAYAVDAVLKTPIAHPRFEPRPLEALRNGQRVFLWESPVLARRLLTRQEATDQDVACDAFGSTSRSPLIVRRTGCGVEFAHAGGDDGLHRILRAWAFAGGVMGPAGEWELTPSSKNLPGHLAGPADSVLTVLLEQPRDGTHDFQEHVPGGGLWSIDPVTGRPMNAATGKVLCNRQEFPSLAVRDDALLAGTVERLLAMDDPDLGWKTIPMGETEKIKVSSPLDILWALSNAACAETAAGPRERHPVRTHMRQPAEPEQGPAPAGKPAPTPLAQPRMDIAHIEQLVVDFGKDKAGHRKVGPAAVGGRVDWEAAVATLSEEMWVCRNITEMLGNAPEQDMRVHAIVKCRLDQCTFLRNEVLEIAVSVDRGRTLASFPGGGPGKSPSGRGIARGGFRKAKVVAPALPASPEFISSDGLSRLYLCARSGPARLELHSKCLLAGATENIGLEDASYHGAWFDPEQEGVYSVCFLPDAHRAGIDIFDRDGKHSQRVLLDNKSFFNPMYISRIRGNSRSLFLMDYACWLMYELDKQTLEITDIHQFQGIFGSSDFKCFNNSIYSCDIIENLVAKYDLATKRAESIFDMNMTYPAQIEYDEENKNTIVLALEKIPNSITPVRHWLRIFDDEFNMIASTSLGSMFVRGMTFMNKSRRVVLVDHYGGIICYDVGHDQPGLLRVQPPYQSDAICLAR